MVKRQNEKIIDGHVLNFHVQKQRLFVICTKRHNTYKQSGYVEVFYTYVTVRVWFCIKYMQSNLPCFISIISSTQLLNLLFISVESGWILSENIGIYPMNLYEINKFII